jgi:hypothetical protein
MSQSKLDGEDYYNIRDKFVQYARNPVFKTLPPKIQGEHKRCLDIIEAIVLCGETPKLKRTFLAQLIRVNAMMGEFCQMHPDFKSAGWGW